MPLDFIMGYMANSNLITRSWIGIMPNIGLDMIQLYPNIVELCTLKRQTNDLCHPCTNPQNTNPQKMKGLK